MSTSTDQSRFMRFAAAVADLGDPFYAEERQRDVWNEASAFGFQLVLWGGLALGAVMLWVGGHDALPYAAALMSVIGLASVLTIGYAQRLGVQVQGTWSVSRRRHLALAVVLGALGLGVVRAAGADAGLDADVSTIAGMLAGGAATLLVIWQIGRRLVGRRSPGGQDAE